MSEKHSRRQEPGENTPRPLPAAPKQVTDEKTALTGHLAQLDAWDIQHRISDARLSQLDHLARQAATKSAAASPEDHRRAYELRDLRIDVTPERTCDICGTVPTHGRLVGELPTEAPRHPCRNLPTIAFHLVASRVMA